MAARKSIRKKTTKNNISKSNTKREAQEKTSAKSPDTDVKPQLKTEVAVIAVLALSVLLVLSVFTDSVGAFGTLINKLLFGLFGIGAMILPFVVMLGCAFAGFKKFKGSSRLKNSLISALFLAFISIAHVMYLKNADLKTSGIIEYITYFARNGGKNNGGAAGAVIGGALVKIIGTTGAYVILGAIVIISFVIITERSVFELLSNAAAKTAITAKKINTERKMWIENRGKNPKPPTAGKDSFEELKGRISRNSKNFDHKLKWEKDDLAEYERQKELVESNPERFGFAEEDGSLNAPDIREILESSGVGIHADKSLAPEESEPEADESFGDDIVFGNFDADKPPFEPDSLGDAREKAIQINDYINNDTASKTAVNSVPAKIAPNEFIDYVFPPLELLHKSENNISRDTKSLMLKNAQKLEETLKSFGVVARVVQINKGPTVTRYELTPDSGVKVSRIVGLADDIALNLASDGIRIEAPVPGKPVVGIEVPNKDRTPVYLREVLESDEFQKFSSKVAFGVGKDIGGSAIVADISDMPHLLIAGATGAGKSVCINTLIMSILYKASPNEVKLILIDPKVVELGVYDGIPHLLRSVVTDPKEAANALNWGVREMNNRYNLFKEENVRDLKGYNSSKAEKIEFDAILPNIVIIIDELSDLMMTAPKDVEDSIMRLAQKARAAGIHLVLATQRPSVDVITGVIKANIPSRLAFAVSSGTDSRTILDMVGAEKLLGRGDMLFSPRDLAKPVRVQGAFISDKEVEKIVDFVKEHTTVEYDEQIAEEIITAAKLTVNGATDDGGDDLYDEVLEFVLTKKEVSVSMLQRQFRIGYNRAARLMDTFEKNGVVSGAADSAGKPSRKVLMNSCED